MRKKGRGNVKPKKTLMILCTTFVLVTILKIYNTLNN